MENIKPRADLDDLDGYHSPQLDLKVKLNTNESPYPPSKKFLKRLKKELGGIELNRYPDREATKLKEALAGFHNISPDNLILGNGSNEVLQSILLSYAGSSGKVAIFEPTYALHSHIAKIVGAEVILGQRNQDWQVDINELESVLEHSPKIVFLCSPNNPTGTVETPEFFQKAIEICADANALLLVDEAYSNFAGNNLPKQSENLIVVHTFSKYWALAGLRLGYAITSEWIVSEVKKILLPYNLNVLTQKAGELILVTATEQEDCAAKISQSRQQLFEGFLKIKEDYEVKTGRQLFKTWESKANFIFFKVLGSEFSAKGIWEELVNRSVLIRYYDVGGALEDCLRVTVGKPEEINRFLDALEEIIDK